MIAKLVIGASMIVIVSSSVAGLTSPPEKVVDTLFRDKELVDYVCADSDGHCVVAEFGRRLKSKRIDIAASPGRKSEAILVEPVVKHRQYFSAMFAKHGREYREIFSADTSMSGITILPAVRNGYLVVQAVARDSNSDWMETDFVFDPKRAYYRPGKTRCMRELDGEVAERQC